MEQESQSGSEQVRALTTGEFMSRPEDLRCELEARGALEFVPFASGLFPASYLSPEMAKATGMDFAWLRDNGFIGNALRETGRDDLAAPLGRAMLDVLHGSRDLLDGVVGGRLDPSDQANRLPIRVRGSDLTPDTEPRIQNDSTGYALWLTSKFINAGVLSARAEDLDVLAQTVRYLDKIEYWRDKDDGHWEENRSLHATSIGVVIGGLKAVWELFDQVGYRYDIDFPQLIQLGKRAMYDVLERSVTEFDEKLYSQKQKRAYPKKFKPDKPIEDFFRHFSVNRRQFDAAMLFLVEPLGVITGSQAARIVMDIEQHLRREHGFARYIGDTYFGPDFELTMPIEERTTAAEGRTERRNQRAAGIALTQTEAQWTLFDPLLSVYWGKRYRRTGSESAREYQRWHLDRHLSQFVPTADGRLLIPELRYLTYSSATGNQWIPNDHMPLIWPQANSHLALKLFEETS